MRVLLVEDDVSMMSMMKIALSREGFELDMAARGREAIEFINQQEYDMIVLDLMLPDMDGYQLLRDIRGKG